MDVQDCRADVASRREDDFDAQVEDDGDYGERRAQFHQEWREEIRDWECAEHVSVRLQRSEFVCHPWDDGQLCDYRDAGLD